MAHVRMDRPLKATLQPGRRARMAWETWEARCEPGNEKARREEEGGVDGSAWTTPCAWVTSLHAGGRCEAKIIHTSDASHMSLLRKKQKNIESEQDHQPQAREHSPTHRPTDPPTYSSALPPGHPSTQPTMHPPKTRCLWYMVQSSRSGPHLTYHIRL